MYQAASPRSSLHTQRYSAASFGSRPGSPDTQPPPQARPRPRPQPTPYTTAPLEPYYPYPTQDALSSSYFNVGEAEVEEAMDINRLDEEFVLRARAPRSRMRRLASRVLGVLALPVRLPLAFLRRRRAARRSRSSTAARSSSATGMGFRDSQPVPPSVRLQYSREGSDGVGRVHEDVLVPPTAPVTMLEVGMTGGRDEDEDEDDDVELGRTTSQRSRFSQSRHSHRSPSHHSHSGQTHGDTTVVHHDAAIAAAEATAAGGGGFVHPSARTSASTPFPANPPPSAYKDSSHTSRSRSTYSQRTSLLGLAVRLFHGARALYRLPWIAPPHARVAVDFVPALASARSKYRMRPCDYATRGMTQTGAHMLRGVPLQVPQADLAAASAVAGLTDGESWYRPSAQQIQKRRTRAHVKRIRNRHHPGRHHHHFDSSQANLLHRQASAGLSAYPFGPAAAAASSSPGSSASPFGPHGSPYTYPYGTQPMYFFHPPQMPGQPGPGAPNPNTGGGVGPRPRPGSAVSSSTARPRPTHSQSASPGSSGRSGSDVRPPPPAVQQQTPGPMYMQMMPAFMSPSTGSPMPLPPLLPPSYSHMFPGPYQYPPAWMQQQGHQQQQPQQQH
ncbi:hypothetical protein DFH11DRAFT_1818825 [Phellopilus nigrolimitatus]|nr:hypothetical protein DFH11DRAFT_1818825 [Phellopilus nigrolimitatus]